MSSNATEGGDTTAATAAATNGSTNGGGGGGEETGKKIWWNKVLDLDEAKHQVVFSFPMILTNAFYYVITLVSVMFAGHLGELELAGSTLGNSWGIVTGTAVMTGLSGALETLCGQAFGARQFRMLGVYLQASCVISVLLSIIISVIWIFTEPILILLRQDHDIAREAAVYLKYFIPALFAYGFLQNILRFLQTQSVVMPLIVLSGIPTGIHVGIAYALVNKTNLGYKGAPIAASISLWLCAIVLALYVVCTKKFKETWEGLSCESFRYVISTFKLALPSAGMVCLEYWAFEVLVILAGMMPNAEVTTSLIAMCVNTEAIAFMGLYGLSAAVSTRVSNELGAGNIDRAKNAMFVTLKLTVVLALIIVLALVFGHDGWSGLFSNSPAIKKAFAGMTPFLAASITVDAFQAILSGVVRGIGWQNIAVIANLGTFYFIGMPIAIVLGFKAKLHAKGLWIGLICGLIFQGFALLLVLLTKKWTQMKLPEEQEEEEKRRSQEP